MQNKSLFGNYFKLKLRYVLPDKLSDTYLNVGMNHYYYIFSMILSIFL